MIIIIIKPETHLMPILSQIQLIINTKFGNQLKDIRKGKSEKLFQLIRIVATMRNMNQLVGATKGNVSTAINLVEILRCANNKLQQLKPVLGTTINWPNDYLLAIGNWQLATSILQLVTCNWQLDQLIMQWPTVN